MIETKFETMLHRFCASPSRKIMIIGAVFPSSLPLPHLLRHSTAFLLSTIAAASSTSANDTSLSVIVNDLCRILSDFRSPHHDLESALHPFSYSVSPDTAEQVLKRCCHLPCPAHRFFLWSSSLPGFLHTPTSPLVLLELLASARLFPLAWTLLSDFRAQFARLESFHLLFRAYARAALPADAVRAFRKMPDFGLDPSIDDLHHLIFALCHYGLVAPAQEFFDKTKTHFSVTPKSFTILMNGWASVRKAGEAQKLFDEMLQSGHRADLASYNSLMAALCKGGELDEAQKWFQEMQNSHGLEPDSASFAVFIRAYCDAKDFNSCIRVLDHMKRRNLTPNVFTYNAIIKLLCEKEKSNEAYELLDEMTSRGAKPDAWSYNAILALHSRLHEVNKAHRLLARMDRDSCSPNRHTYNMLLKMLIAIGRFDRAEEVWESMERRRFYPSASSYAVMIHGLCRKKGMIGEASRYFEMMLDEGIPPYLSTCELLRGELRRLGMAETIERLADRMRRSSSCTIQEMSSAMEGRRRTPDGARGRSNLLIDAEV
ncbi:Pentatricopeptide repeat-containing protein [Apostasia shenzhenica]|uniref:Pentatricopeptide repeat-containing protein n=1 Tax=Apostasia shenzhenica TaxID=1088818 RepID=A0A2H9ZXF3_9ASPA|nr:Pentatricopeptide repeat-containing protein [Apostasia shenzhenica]